MTSSPELTTEQTPPPAYFGSLTIENVKCFKGEQTIDLSDGHGKPALWTVILGNNNTGKTTLLRCLAYLEPKFVSNIHSVYPKYFFESEQMLDYELNLPVKLHSKLFINFNEGYYQLDWGISLKKIASDIVSHSSSCDLPYAINELHLSGNEATLNKKEKILIIYSYGTSRRMSKASLLENQDQDNSATLFDENATLTNSEEWLLQTFFAEKLNKPKASETLEKIKKVLISGILPDAKDFDFDTTDNFQGFVKIKTDYGWVKLRELGYGYQVTLAWVVDLAKKLFERYPNSENPLHEPAIVLIDEIDLHLHPEWQRKIISFLSEQFPRTQFIATTHSPLIVQSAENINLVILEKQQDHVIIKQRPDIKTFKGWTVEEILTELMGMDDKTLSDDYLKSMHQFDEALDEDDYHKAKQAYDELDKILHPRSVQRKLLSIQMSGLSAD
jgi:predicted ATP-binding protein involved in virulence